MWEIGEKIIYFGMKEVLEKLSDPITTASQLRNLRLHPCPTQKRKTSSDSNCHVIKRSYS